MEFVLIGIAIILFVAAYVTKRRFGLLGLGMAAGSIISGIWGYEAGLVASVFGISSGSIATSAATMATILLPAIILLFRGSGYKTIVGQVAGAGLFMILAMAFISEPLGHILTVQGFGASAYAWLLTNRMMIIGFGLILAIIDLFLMKPANSHPSHHKR